MRDHWSEQQKTVGGVIGINIGVHMLWHVPGLQVGSPKHGASCEKSTWLSADPYSHRLTAHAGWVALSAAVDAMRKRCVQSANMHHVVSS